MATADRKAIVAAALWAGWILVAHVFAAAIVIMVMGKVADRTISAFDELDVDLPAISVLAYQISDYCRTYWYTLSVFFIVDAVLLFTLRLTPPKIRWSSEVVAVLGFFTCILLLSFASLAISLPFEAGAIPTNR
jgi:hypothetical protein